jgi:hypothetical protein
MLMLLCVWGVQTNNNESIWRKKKEIVEKKKRKETTNFLSIATSKRYASVPKKQKCDYTCSNHNLLVSQKEKKKKSGHQGCD